MRLTRDCRFPLQSRGQQSTWKAALSESYSPSYPSFFHGPSFLVQFSSSSLILPSSSMCLRMYIMWNWYVPTMHAFRYMYSLCHLYFYWTLLTIRFPRFQRTFLIISHRFPKREIFMEVSHRWIDDCRSSNKNKHKLNHPLSQVYLCSFLITFPSFVPFPYCSCPQIHYMRLITHLCF